MKGKKQRKDSHELISLTFDEYRVFENFFQYGDLKNAKLLFVGLEEGLGGQSPRTVTDSRIRWSRGVGKGICKFEEHGVLSDAFYINDIAEAAWDVTKECFNNDRNKFEIDLSIRGVMMYQARMICLLTSNFEFLNKSAAQKTKELRDCFHHILHKPESGTAMIERYPLPMQTIFPFQVEGLSFDNYNSYIAYNEQPDNHRVQLIKAMYDTYEIPVSIVYAGIRKNEFKLLPFYRDVLGFTFEERHTNESNHNSPYVSTITKENAKKFLIGSRKKNDGSIQKAIITPFLGVGNLSYTELDAITSWIDIKL